MLSTGFVFSTKVFGLYRFLLKSRAEYGGCVKQRSSVFPSNLFWNTSLGVHTRKSTTGPNGREVDGESSPHESTGRAVVVPLKVHCRQLFAHARPTGLVSQFVDGATVGTFDDTILGINQVSIAIYCAGIGYRLSLSSGNTHGSRL